MAIDKDAGYYDAGGIETLAYIEAKLGPELFTGFLLGNVIRIRTNAPVGGASPS